MAEDNRSSDAEATAEAGAESSFGSLIRAVAAAPDRMPELPPGAIVDDDYRIERRLGAGGMGVVYLARDLRLQRLVAIKLHVGDGGARSQREAMIMARLIHPNVVTVHAVGTWQDQVYIAMEYLDGGTLRGWLAARRRSWREVLAIFLETAAGLAAAHDAGLIHRDFKPDNVLIGSDGRVRLGDFGVARRAPEESITTSAPAHVATAIGEPGLTTLTTEGARVGTPGYMAPEAERGEAVDARADQFSFCVALRAALDGRRAPGWLQRIIARGLAEDPRARWPSMAALIAAIRGARRRRRVALAGAAITVGAAAALLLTYRLSAAPPQDRRCSGGDAQLRAAWSPARAAAIHDRDTVAALDSYGHAWLAMHREACVATTVRGEQSQAILDYRMACLERARLQLGATVDGIAAGVDRVHAAHAIAVLPLIADCGSITAIPAGPIPPADPAQRQELAELQAAAAKAYAQESLGDLGAAAATLDAILPRARRLGWAPLIAELAFRAGAVHQQHGDDGDALLAEAAAAAITVGDDVTATWAWTHLAQLALISSDPAGADRWLTLARGGQRRIGSTDARLELELTRTEAERLRATGHIEEAITTLQRVVEGARAPGVSADVLPQALLSLGSAQASGGQLVEAEATLGDAVVRADALFAPDNMVSHRARTWQALVLAQRGDYDRAAAISREVIAGVRARQGHDSLETADALATLGATMLFAQRGDEARAPLEQARAILLARSPRDDARLGSVVSNLAIVDGLAGKPEAAYQRSLEALDILSRIYAPDAPELINPEVITGAYERDAGHLEAAATRLAAALTRAVHAFPPAHMYRLSATNELAKTRLLQHQPDAAIALAEELVRTYDDPWSLADARFLLARALREAGRDPARARSLAKQARAFYADRADGAADRAAMDAFLAK
jgi:tetratricopeptide (TPR) repeat protein